MSKNNNILSTKRILLFYSFINDYYEIKDYNKYRML